MTVHYADPNAGINVPIKSRTESGQHILARDIERLPGTVEQDIAESRSYLEQLAGTIASSRVAVDLSGTLSGYLQSLASSIAAGRIQSDILSLPGTVAADLATLAGAIASGSMRSVLQASSATIGKLAANVGVNIGTVDTLLPNAPSTASVAPVTMNGTTAVTLFAAKADRTFATVNNPTTLTLYIKFGSGATTSDWSYSVPANSQWEMPKKVWGGIITGVLSAAGSLNVMCTET